MSQQNIFDDWEENKEAAITSATYNANLDWMEAAKYAGECVAKEKAYFTVDDIWNKLKEQEPTLDTHEQSAIGGVLRHLVRIKLASNTKRQTKSAKSHHDGVTVWKSNVIEATTPVEQLYELRKAAPITENSSLTIKHIIKESHETAKDKGWWDKEPNIGEKLALIHSEVSEALEAYRDHGEKEMYRRKSDGKPEGFIFELADTVIRIADLCGKLDLELDKAIDLKMKFNKTRPYRHGNKNI